MKKYFMLFLIIFITITFYKYSVSNYNIEYKLKDYNVKTNYKENRFYYEIKSKNYTYNFDIYAKRKFSKLKINDIKYIKDEEFHCIYPIIKGYQTYPLCYDKDNNYIDYNLIDSPLLEEYKIKQLVIEKPKKDFVFYNNLEEYQYVALWNYNGYVVMNGKTYENIRLFDKDKYDNTLSYLLEDTLYIANYNEEHEYNKLITLNLKTLKRGEVKLDYKIDFNSYIVGNVGKNMYIYDNKHSVLYEVDLKKEKTKIKSNNEIGFVKFKNDEFVSCSKSEYSVNKINYSNTKIKSNYKYTVNNITSKMFLDNKKITEKILDFKANIIKEDKNILFYIYDDYLYLYSPQLGSIPVFYNYELAFNSDNTVFIYLNN